MWVMGASIPTWPKTKSIVEGALSPSCQAKLTLDTFESQGWTVQPSARRFSIGFSLLKVQWSVTKMQKPDSESWVDMKNHMEFLRYEF